MQQQHRAHVAAKAGRGRQHTASPQEILAAIDQLVARLQRTGAGADRYAAWAVATLANRLNIISPLSVSTDPIGIVHDLGVAWATEFATALDEHPDQTAQVLRAAMSAIQQVVDEVRQRGLAG